MFEFDGILLKPCLLQACFHVAGTACSDGRLIHHELVIGVTNTVATGVCKIDTRSKRTRYDSQTPFPKV